MIQKSAGASPSPIVARFQFEDFAVSWAGQGRDDGEFCFGSEDGRLKFTTVEGVPTGETVCGDEQGEAVNGVAFSNRFIAVSSRTAVTFWVPSNGGSEQWARSVFPCGAHGVTATRTGQFVAPLGPTGLMKAEPGQEPQPAVAVNRVRSADRTLDYYKLIDLYSAGYELLACAVRFSGVAVLDLSQELDGGQIKSVSVSSLDFVDLCSLASPSTPRAAAAVARTGALLLFKDLLDHASPIVVKFDDIKGVAYRVLCIRGSVLLLTSVGLYVLHGLAKRFLEGEQVASTRTWGQFIPIEAVDANICGDRWLLAVMPVGCLRIDLTALLVESSTSATDEQRTTEAIPRSPLAEPIDETYVPQPRMPYQPVVNRAIPAPIASQSELVFQTSVASE